MEQRQLRDMIPKSRRDLATLTFFICGIPFAIWFETNVVHHSYKTTAGICQLHLLLCTFLAVQVYWNLFYMLRVDTTINGLRKYSAEQFLYSIVCKKCDKSPPRSHHCKVCDICILKRDHHCWFAGYCAGYQNHRYYLMVVIYSFIGGLYANLLHYSFMVETLGISFRTLVSMIAPHFLWGLGFYTTYEFSIAVVCDIAFYFTGLLMWLLLRQMIQIFQGQTAFERSYGTRSFDKGPFKNIQEVLGAKWYLCWIAPCIISELPSIENHWTTAKQKDL